MDKYWFKPKDYGWGIGIPIAWQGWVALLFLLSLYVGAAFIVGFFVRPIPVNVFLRFFLAVFIISALFLLILRNKIEGGLKWRWGKDKKH